MEKTPEKNIKDIGKDKRVIISTENLQKSFVVGKNTVPVLNDISVDFYTGDFTIIYGPSGSGKSTLLNCILGLELPTSGKIWVGGERLDKMTEDDRAFVRLIKFGVVHQQPIWVKSLTILENVALPLLIHGAENKTAYERAKKTLADVGMEQWKDYKPTEISGGQQQKVSLARALVHNPRIIILDEPTGNLDSHASDEVMMILQELNKKHNRTIIMVTHNMIYLPYANKTINVKDGTVSKTIVEQDAIFSQSSIGDGK